MIELTSAKGTSGTIICNLLTELEVPFTVGYIDLATTHCDKESSIFGKVPQLRNDAVSLTQTLAICLYICDSFDFHGQMLSLNPNLRFKQIDCLIALATDIQPIIRMLFKSNIKSNLDFESSIKEAVNYIKTKLEESHGTWLFGDRHTLNDLYAFELMRWVSNTRYSICLAPIIPWIDKCLTLDSIQKSIKGENLKVWRRESS